MMSRAVFHKAPSEVNAKGKQWAFGVVGDWARTSTAYDLSCSWRHRRGRTGYFGESGSVQHAKKPKNVEEAVGTELKRGVGNFLSRVECVASVDDFRTCLDQEQKFLHESQASVPLMSCSLKTQV